MLNTFYHIMQLNSQKKDQSITYLVFDAEDASLVGYFSLAIKPISIRASNINKTMAKKLSRVSILDEETQAYTTAAYLIAQLGKNYSLPREKRISGNILLGFALETIVTAVLFSMVGYFNGNNRTVWVMAQGLIQTLLVRLPLAYYMSVLPDTNLTKIGLAAPVSTIVGIILNIGFYLYLNHTEQKKAQI